MAALYVQDFDDPVTVDAASAVEDLAASLSRTIWQEIVILDRVVSPGLPAWRASFFEMGFRRSLQGLRIGP